MNMAITMKDYNTGSLIGIPEEESVVTVIIGNCMILDGAERKLWIGPCVMVQFHQY